MFSPVFRNLCGPMAMHAGKNVITITLLVRCSSRPWFSIAVLWIFTAPLSAGVNPDGSYSETLPIEIPAGRNGVQPKLALAYDSNAPNGIAGVGMVAGAAGGLVGGVGMAVAC